MCLRLAQARRLPRADLPLRLDWRLTAVLQAPLALQLVRALQETAMLLMLSRLPVAEQLLQVAVVVVAVVEAAASLRHHHLPAPRLHPIPQHQLWMMRTVAPPGALQLAPAVLEAQQLRLIVAVAAAAAAGARPSTGTPLNIMMTTMTVITRAAVRDHQSSGLAPVTAAGPLLLLATSRMRLQLMRRTASTTQTMMMITMAMIMITITSRAA